MPVMACNFRTKSQGTLEFGAIDSTAYIGPLTTVPVNNHTDGSWTVDNVTFPAGDRTVTQGMLFGSFAPSPKWYLLSLMFFTNKTLSRHWSSMDDRSDAGRSSILGSSPRSHRLELRQREIKQRLVFSLQHYSARLHFRGWRQKAHYKWFILQWWQIRTQSP